MVEDPCAYLKWPRLIVFNLNGALSITATALAVRALVVSNHNKEELVSLSWLATHKDSESYPSLKAKAIPGAKLHATNVLVATKLMTASAGVASVYTAVLATAITLKWYKMETRRTIRIREAAMACMAILLLGSAILGTIIIVPRSAGASSPTLPQEVIIKLIIASGKSVKYRDTLAFPCLIVIWCCFGTTVLSFILAALTSRHIGRYGPEDLVVRHYVSEQQGELPPGEGSAMDDHASEKKAEKVHVERVDGQYF